MVKRSPLYTNQEYLGGMSDGKRQQWSLAARPLGNLLVGWCQLIFFSSHLQLSCTRGFKKVVQKMRLTWKGTYFRTIG